MMMIEPIDADPQEEMEDPEMADLLAPMAPKSVLCDLTAGIVSDLKALDVWPAMRHAVVSLSLVAGPGKLMGKTRDLLGELPKEHHFHFFVIFQ